MVILLLDNDPDIRTRHAALLQQRGHTVIQAASPVEAVHWGNESKQLDLLITEVVLDGETFGFDLRDAIREKFPTLRTVYTTRYDLSGYEQDLEGAIPLPVTVTDEEYVQRVEAVLNAAPTGPLAAVEAVPVAEDESLHEAAVAAVPMLAPVENQPILAPGTLLGHYQVLERLYEEAETETYHALQFTVQRRVALVLLKPQFLGTPQVVNQFKDRERVKASFNHPRIAPLYEAGEAGGWLYYTRELPNGYSLDQIVAQGRLLTERELVEILYRTSEAMNYASSKDCSHRPLSERDIYLDAEGLCSIVNIFRPAGPTSVEPREDVARTIQMLARHSTQGKARGLIQQLLSEGHDWSSLCLTMKEMREEMSERSLLKKAAQEQQHEPPPSKNQRILLAVAAGVVLLGVALIGSFTGGSANNTEPMVRETMVSIPAGEFLYQSGQKMPCAGFQISKHEVTIGQYAEFLAVLKSASDKRQWDDPLQSRFAPQKKGHEPVQWEQSYAAAKTGGMFNNHPITLNTPVTRVDYWDAAAYARWRGGRLPTEEEWEKAARGTGGNTFPWGKDANPAAANLGDDYSSTGVGGTKDGYNLWAPERDESADVSVYGIVDTAGNVEEWTSSTEAHPTLADKLVPVVRGGHFALTSAKGATAPLTRRVAAESYDEATLARGFRIVKSS
jgi:formylglycine-generating enzyme required for sulfatase activity/CheY-like chemotaxis protein